MFRLGENGLGGDAVHPDAERARLEGGVAGEHLDAGLGGIRHGRSDMRATRMSIGPSSCSIRSRIASISA
jgi:hypothetical protein